MYGRKNVFFGTVFIIIGILFFAVNMNLISIGYIFSRYWPLLFVIVPGLLMHLAFFFRASPAGILVPGGILLTIGLVLQISSIFGMWSVTWPGYIMAPAVGLSELYAFGRRRKGLLIPVFILGFISLMLFSVSLGSFVNFRLRSFLAVALIVLGLYIIFNKGSKK